MKTFILCVVCAFCYCGSSLAQLEGQVKISRCTKTNVSISQIDIIGMPIPRDEKGRQISQIESGFTTLYVSSKPKLVDLDRIQDISNVFNGAINPTDLSTKSGKFVPVGLESESVSFTILRNKRYYLLNTYPDFPDHVIVIELTKIIDRDDVNIFTLKTPFGKNVFLYPSLAKVLIGAGKSIK